MKYTILLLAVNCFFLQACSQDNIHPANKPEGSLIKVGGGCEGCEAIYESPVPFEKLGPTATFPDFNTGGPKIEISGIIYQRDGKTPAAGVIMYVYHTDQQGIYPKKGDEQGWAKRHGYLRAWIKTDDNGQYTFYTRVPASYPNSNNPKHIHPVIKEPGKTEYWINEFVFDDDPLLPERERTQANPVGGSGVLKPVMKDGMLRARRDIILGLHVQDYPKALTTKPESGLALGANCPAFDPLHLSGMDKGKRTCPMCKYGYAQGIMVWFNHANLDTLHEFVSLLEKAMHIRGEKKIRVFMIYMNPFYKSLDKTEEKIVQGKIEKWCMNSGLNKVAMVWVPSPVDEETSALFRINPAVTNTVLLYKKRRVAAKWVNIAYNKENVTNILEELDKPI